MLKVYQPHISHTAVDFSNFIIYCNCTLISNPFQKQQKVRVSKLINQFCHFYLYLFHVMIHMNGIHGHKNEWSIVYEGYFKNQNRYLDILCISRLHWGQLHLSTWHVYNIEIQEQHLAAQCVARIKEDNELWDQWLANPQVAYAEENCVVHKRRFDDLHAICVKDDSVVCERWLANLCAMLVDDHSIICERRFANLHAIQARENVGVHDKQLISQRVVCIAEDIGVREPHLAR